MCSKNASKSYKNVKAQKEKQDVEQKRHAILWNYIMMYGLDCITPHASEDDAYHVFFLTTCDKMHRQHVLCIWMSHNHYIKCGDCLLEFTELSAISEWQRISKPLRWVWVSCTPIFFTSTISGFYRYGKWMDHFHSHCLWPLLHWNYPPIFSSFLCLPLKTTGRSPSHALPDIG